MNKDIKKLIYLLNESLFDDDELFDLDSDSLYDDKTLTDAYKANIYSVIIPILGTDKPRGWKKVKDEHNEDILFYEKKGLGACAGWHEKAVGNVIEKLKDNGFKEYNNAQFPVAVMYKFNNLKQWEKSSKFPKYIGNYNWVYRQNHKFTNDMYKKYEDDFQKILTYPEYVQKLFYNDDHNKCVYLSPDQGIALIIKDSHYTLDELSQPDYTYTSTFFQAILKLTGEVYYSDMAHKEKTDLLNKHKDIKRRIDMLQVPYNKLHDHNFKIFKLNTEGYPYSIKYFKWNSEISKMPKSLSKLNIPRIIYDLFKHKGFQPVQQFDKEDDKSEIELLNNCLSIKAYKNIKTKDMPKGTDSCLIIELTGYLKDHYTNLYLNNKK